MIAVNGSLNERRLGQIHQQTTSTRGPCEKKNRVQQFCGGGREKTQTDAGDAQ